MAKSAVVEKTKKQMLLDLLAEMSPEEKAEVAEDVKAVFPTGKKVTAYDFEKEKKQIEYILGLEEFEAVKNRAARSWNASMNEAEKKEHREAIEALVTADTSNDKAEVKWRKAVQAYICAGGLGYSALTFREDIVKGTTKRKAK